ncbi:transglycosylase domain-containing protein [Flavobacterium psychrophilum]|uniref:transglycosylase domain-containing protein n=1 Tax=Flavobacterium psychrophilum TaxID=96345 RepID=UPI000B7C2D60|nr:biosynthetic peptidoglycan transglycosylase [Flavobacterium psychrophilum]MCB6089070.1 transglycosylase domain-containing protein [Flavobacterium psychrophilum]SNA75394.1 Penicillin-binding protein [Flavobacterium psychrophilum]SNB18697.1 Penicillin-binding protein [Flavobacterium psychrophilum]
MRSKKQKFFLFLKIIILFLLFSVAGVYFFRDALLQKAIAKATSKFDTDYNCRFCVQKASFDGISSIQLNNIILVPKEADTLFSIEKVKTKINLLQLITGNIQLQNLEVKNGFIQLVKNEQGRNFDAFLKKDKSNDINKKKNYAKLAYRLLSKVLNLVPTEMQLENISLRMDDLGIKVTMQLPKLELKNHQLQTNINVTESECSQKWNVSGFVNPRAKKANVQIYNNDTSKIQLPYVYKRFGFKSSFKNVNLKLDKFDLESNELHLDGLVSVEDFTINHPKIAKKEVLIKTASFDYHFLLGSDFVSIDSTSSAQINKIKLKPFAQYNTGKDTIYKFKILIPKMKAQDFISSLPNGLFTHFTGMKTEGNFDYKLNFKYNKNKPNALVFDSNLNKERLKIVKYGEANLNKLNEEFVYRAIENNVLQRPILVGNSNPNFTPLDQISPYLQKCVLTSEDPSFFSHHGFINEAFKQSITKNIRTKKFSRGASTISMQLIKNVFLTREKTLSRKLEEILLVYLLENNRIASKERMLEVYFNVIEWGPNVYGIGEASSFYFQKKPIDLSLKECLFLASIVPKPKKFMYQFDDQGKLKSFANKHEEFMSKLMLRRGLLTPEDTIGQQKPVFISGRARKHMKFKVQDSIAVDSLFTDFDFN